MQAAATALSCWNGFLVGKNGTVRLALNCLLSVCITSIEPGQSYLRAVVKTIYLKLYFSRFFSAGFPLGRFLGFEFALRAADI